MFINSLKLTKQIQIHNVCEKMEVVTVNNKSIVELVDDMRWTFAKTMPENPHYYIVKREQNSIDYDRLYWYIFDHPTLVEYEGYKYKTAIIGERMYWIMTDDFNESRIINRKHLKEASAWVN